jgi:hypothetical protein
MDSSTRERRRPTPAELGLDVTIAVVILTFPDVFVCTTDLRVSFGDVAPAQDEATIKTLGIGEDWWITYASSDISVVLPILHDIRAMMRGRSGRWDTNEVKNIVADVYNKHLQSNFIQKKLAKLGYKTIDDFRKEGRNDLGDQFSIYAGS